jgi:dipeptidyl aminopeptidase/acylaminoacyl peptidase
VEPQVSGLYLGSVAGGPPTRLGAAESGGSFLAPGRVVIVQQGNLVARRFDDTPARLSDDVTILARSVGPFSVSASGVIAHRAATANPLRTTWVDRSGRELGELAAAFNGPELSPDARRLAGDRTVDGNRDVWLLDVVRGGLTRFTTHPAVDGYPLWSPDGRRLAFHSQRNGTIDLWARAASGAGADELLLSAPDNEWPLHWSRDGRFLLFQRSDLSGGFDLWALPMTGGDRAAIPVATTPFIERLGEFSPDGRWVAYETDESGQAEVVVQSFPAPGGRWPVSTDGGSAPRWRADGRELYFVARDGTMMAVAVPVAAERFEPGPPAALFETHLGAQTFKNQYAVAGDGRFVLTSVTATTTAPPINVILNVAR